jgi:PAS domain S-box-containing protein
VVDPGGDGGVSGDTEPEDSRYRHLVEHIQDAVAEFELVDETPVVRAVNGAFVDTFGYAAEDLVGESLNDRIVPDWRLEEARGLDARTAAGEVTYRRVKRETAAGLREFLYRGVPLPADTTPVDGIAVYTDLTEITRHERRLQVMNRVLRHNLRNDVNVVLGHTESLRAGSPDPDAVERIAAAARRLVTLADEAAAIDRALNAPVGDATVDCVPVVRAAVADVRGRFPAATVETDLPPSLVVRATDHLGVAVESLVDNAARHNPAPEPAVRVRATATATDGWADVWVEDDGPRIPADERRVVVGDAPITGVRHGSGLGLWVVKWVTESFGGAVSFAESDLGGNAVRLRLPR